VTRLKDENWSLDKEVIKLTRDNLERHELCLSFTWEQIRDLNSAILATTEWWNNTMLVLNKAKKMKEEVEALCFKVTEYTEL
jgi:hypothetical protein